MSQPKKEPTTGTVTQTSCDVQTNMSVAPVTQSSLRLHAIPWKDLFKNISGNIYMSSLAVAMPYIRLPHALLRLRQALPKTMDYAEKYGCSEIVDMSCALYGVIDDYIHIMSENPPKAIRIKADAQIEEFLYRYNRAISYAGICDSEFDSEYLLDEVCPGGAAESAFSLSYYFEIHERNLLLQLKQVLPKAIDDVRKYGYDPFIPYLWDVQVGLDNYFQIISKNLPESKRKEAGVRIKKILWENMMAVLYVEKFVLKHNLKSLLTLGGPDRLAKYELYFNEYYIGTRAKLNSQIVTARTGICKMFKNLPVNAKNATSLMPEVLVEEFVKLGQKFADWQTQGISQKDRYELYQEEVISELQIFALLLVIEGIPESDRFAWMKSLMMGRVFNRSTLSGLYWVLFRTQEFLTVDEEDDVYAMPVVLVSDKAKQERPYDAWAALKPSDYAPQAQVDKLVQIIEFLPIEKRSEVARMIRRMDSECEIKRIPNYGKTSLTTTSSSSI